jgi:hypothetical protein
MDRKQLVTIAITAVTSVIAKEVISWLVALLRSNAQTQVAKAKARTIFKKNNRRMLFAIAFFGVTVSRLWSVLHETNPLTRPAVAWLVVAMANFGAAALFFLGTVISRIDDWKERRFKMVHPFAPVPAPSVSEDTADSPPTPDTPTASH